jgi:hypothetical protein
VKVAIAVLIGLLALETSVVIVSWGGQVAEQERNYYRCRLDAARNYPKIDPNDPYSEGAVYVENCMGAAGFAIEVRWDDNLFCKPGDDHRRITSFCYAPIGHIARWLYHVEKWAL